MKTRVVISDITLIPGLALAIRMQFKNEEDFYHACIDTLIEECQENFGVDGNFDEVHVGTGKRYDDFLFMYLIMILRMKGYHAFLNYT